MAQSQSKSKSKTKTKAKRPPKPTMAAKADIHELYQRSVQSPEADCELFAKIFRELRGRAPVCLREDFCGTALLSATWCLSNRKRRAIGVDLDAPTLAWGRAHNVEPHAKAIGKRLQLVEADVLEVDGLEPADIIAALNFSFCIFKQRAVLERYFARCRAGLADDGLLILEMFGGTTAIDVDDEARELDGFEYQWEQASFDPLTNEILCHIHFEFPDGSRIDKAFTYDWRLWSVPELRDLLLGVGFRQVRIYWEKVEDEDEADDDDMLHGSGEYEQIETAEQQDSWLVYLVAEK